MLLFVAVRGLYALIPGKRWPIASAIVVFSSVDQSESRLTRNFEKIYRYTVRYKYQINGVEYESDCISQNDLVEFDYGWDTLERAWRIVADYPAGRSILVRYNPHDPSKAFVKITEHWVPYFFFGLGVLFLAWAYLN